MSKAKGGDGAKGGIFTRKHQETVQQLQRGSRTDTPPRAQVRQNEISRVLHGTRKHPQGN